MDKRESIIEAGIAVLAVLVICAATLLWQAYRECARIEALISESSARIVSATEERRQTGNELVRLLTPAVDPKPAKVFGR